MLVETTKRALVLSLALDAALLARARSARRDVNSIVVQILEDRLVAEGALDAAEAGGVARFWSLVDRVVETAREICREGAFTPDITVRAIARRIETDSSWVEDYRIHVGDDIFKTGNPRKGPINREIGYRVREAIGGAIAVGPDGAPQSQKVLGSVIQSVTLMASFNPEAVAS